ncbi:golgin subfamily A member 6-like protein 1 [Labrus bergylta]|uniref:golgin subfamily A member 6-like protein 1 n=1 Tax=Labrus bergylta TaxID=56723 RepID=UPI00331360CE
MDSRPEPGNKAASAAPQGAQYSPDEVHYLKDALQDAHSEIGNLHDTMISDTESWAKERLYLCHKVHNGRYRVNRLQDLMDIRKNGFKDELQRIIQTISKQELEIARLNTSLKLKDDQMEAAKSFDKEQMEKKEAQLEAERKINSELRDQLFKASLESHKSASLHKDTQMRLDLAKQQVQQRDNFILTLRKEKEGLSQKLLETSAQLRGRENESFQNDPQEENYKALQEKFTKEKEMEEKEKMWMSRINEAEQEKSELVEENQKLSTSVKEMEKENQELVREEQISSARLKELEKGNKVLDKTKETLTTRIEVLEMNDEKQADEEHSLIPRVQEVEMENKEQVNKEKTLMARIKKLEKEQKELELRLTKKNNKKKRGFWSKTIKGKTEQEQQKEQEEKEWKQREKEEQKKKDKEEKTRNRSSWRFWKKRDEEKAPCSSAKVGQQ